MYICIYMQYVVYVQPNCNNCVIELKKTKTKKNKTPPDLESLPVLLQKHCFCVPVSSPPHPLPLWKNERRPLREPI